MELSVLIRVQIPEFGTVTRVMDEVQMEVKKSAWMSLRGLTLVGMEERLLHKGKEQSQAHQD